MFTYYVRVSLFSAEFPEIIAWSCKRNDDVIDFEKRVSGCWNSSIKDTPKYTKEQILKREIKTLGEVRTIKSEIKPSEVWNMISKGNHEELIKFFGS